ncbi:RNA-binding protein 48 isoform X1 [Vigna radiata var. radiata]|uniref:RNA-binding protein 48 n=1 Tax=Vigna radiata var. radiata TaxID=3916 RepID=A0A3Q0ESK6_VIGRR|nr:RNA-binding protein 48 isoform X1 [Vigna radiata var. radiata]
MPRYKDESPAVRVYTVCDESRYLIVRNVPELGCGDDLLQLFSSYGEVEECKPMDAEDCEKYTDVYWIKFRLVSNARFAKRKLDDFVFFGNKLQVSYAPQFETLSDTQDKLEGRRREVLARLNRKLEQFSGSIPHAARRSKETLATSSKETPATSSDAMITSNVNSAQHLDSNAWDVEFKGGSRSSNFPTRISSNEDYFASQSMNRTVNFVRDKLDKIRSSGEHTQAGSASKKQRVDNRRRI